MLLRRRARIVTEIMIAMARAIAVHHHIDRALPRAKRHYQTPFCSGRHESGWRDQLDTENEQSQRGQQAPCSVRFSELPHHARPA